MIRWANRKEAVAWLRANAQGPTGFYMRGRIRVQRALWDGTRWCFLPNTSEDRLKWYQDRCSELLEALEAALAILGDEDLPGNGELSGAAVTDMMRAAVAKAREVAP